MQSSEKLDRQQRFEQEDRAGEQYEIRLPKKVRIRDSRSVVQKFDYKLKKGQSVVDSRIEQTSCKICD